MTSLTQVFASLNGALVSASLPSPPAGVLQLGPLPLRAYGIFMVTAMIVAAWVTYVRYKAAGGEGEVVINTVMWAIPFGIVGARLYHVITTPTGFFGPGGDFMAIFRIWEGGLAIYGAVGLGAVGAFIGLRRDGQRIGPFADALAPGLLLAQAIGRLGNYFNQELFGSPTDLPWGLEVDAAHLPPGYAEGTLFHPTFLYEGLWNILMAVVLIYLGKKLPLKSGQLMSLYLVVYPLGRLWMETMRLDEAKEYFGLRLNSWTSILLIVVGLVAFFVCGRFGGSTKISAEERGRFLTLLTKRNPKRAEELEQERAEKTPVAVAASVAEETGPEHSSLEDHPEGPSGIVEEANEASADDSEDAGGNPR